MNKKYTEKDFKFLYDNYPKYGASYCAKVLGVQPHCIYRMARKLQLKRTGKYRDKHPSMMAVNVNKFLNINDNKLAYFLGFFWADGNIINYKSKNIEYNQIRLEINSDDARDILPIINEIGRWSVRTRNREHWKEQTVINTNNRPLFNFFKDHDYDIKSKESPTKILNKIPEKLKPYFWKGYFDGDGCISYTKLHRYISFCGTYNQKWEDLKCLLNNLGIRYGIYKSIEKNGNKNSKVIIQNKNGIIKFISYLTPTMKIGLRRKSDKMLNFIEVTG